MLLVRELEALLHSPFRRSAYTFLAGQALNTVELVVNSESFNTHWVKADALHSSNVKLVEARL